MSVTDTEAARRIERAHQLRRLWSERKDVDRRSLDPELLDQLDVPEPEPTPPPEEPPVSESNGALKIAEEYPPELTATEQHLVDTAASHGRRPGDKVSISELAEWTGRKPSTIKTHLRNARKKGLWPYRVGISGRRAVLEPLREQSPPVQCKQSPQREESVDHPSHYGGKDNPYEAIKVIEAHQLGFHRGNAVKYLLRSGKKDPARTVEDLRKAIWYVQREIEQHAG